MPDLFQKYRPKIKLLTLSLILVLGYFLRIYDLGGEPFVADEFLDLNSAYTYSQMEEWKAWDFNNAKINETDVYEPRDKRAFVYKWQVAKLYRLLPLNEKNSRLVSVFWGLITILVVYKVSFYFSRRRLVALISAFLFAVSLTGITYDRKLRMYAMFYPVFLTFSWFTYMALEDARTFGLKIFARINRFSGVNLIFLFPAAALGILSLHLHDLTANIIPVIATYLLAMLGLGFFSASPRKVPSKYAQLLFLGILGGMAFWVLEPAMAGRFLGGLHFFMSNFGYLTKLLNDYSTLALAFFFIAVGISYAWQHGLKKEIVWLTASFLVPLLLAIFSWNMVQGQQYIFFLQSFVIIVISLGIYGLADFLRNNQIKYKQAVFWLTVGLCLVILPDFNQLFSGHNTYRRDYNQIANYKKVLGYVKKQKKDDDMVITRNFRNYYLKDAHLPVYDFGGERATHKLSLEEVAEIYSQHPNGWVVIFDNDWLFVSLEAKEFIRENIPQSERILYQGNAEIYRWQK